MIALAWFAGWLAAMLVLFVAALRLPELCWRHPHTGARALVGTALLGLVIAVIMLANSALVRHDEQFDLTRARVFTPAAEALAVVDGLTRPVSLRYFYRADDPDGVRMRRIVEAMGRRNPLLSVATTDPDRDPSLAETRGVKLYNAALLEADGRRVIVQGTDENAIAIGIERVLRDQLLTLCFMTGHAEYPSDNYEFHTHVEALGGDAGHSHGAEAVVTTAGHGVGRMRRALAALGYAVRDVTPAIDARVDPACRVLIDAGPRTPYGAIETAALAQYLANGGAALLMYDPGFAVAASHAQLLRRCGLELPDAVVRDPVQHYAADATNVAATSYDPHPVTERLSFTFYPGVRPLELSDPAHGIDTVALVATSANALTETLVTHTHDNNHDHEHEHAQSPGARTGSRAIAAASSGKLSADANAPFRLIVIGDSDFASNSFYPYMSNSRLALAMVRWLAQDTGGATLTPQRSVNTVELSYTERRALFLSLVLVLPLAIGGLGLIVWWRRR